MNLVVVVLSLSARREVLAPHRNAQMCVAQPSGPSRRLSASRKNKNKQKKGETIKQKGERKERKKRNA
jgi:hypothetical protein